jgi:hypothetical protein
MSLLSQASSYTESVTSKKNPRMKSTFENIQRECEQYKGSTTINEGFEEHNNKQSEREKVVQEILKKTQTQQVEDDSGLASFSNSPVVPLFKVENSPSMPKNTNINSVEAFQKPAHQQQSRGGSNYTDSYAATPYYRGLSTQSGPQTMPQNSQLMEKLNYMIRLLEEQQKEPTQNIMEEFVLYGLLGVFMIYLVDSFARAGKYIR